MATAAQITANQQNAKSSTGPRTREGKLASSQNARKHGLTSVRLIVGPGEQAEWEAFHDALFTELAPQGALEDLTFRQLVRCAWNVERTHKRELELMANGLDPLLDRSVHDELNLILRYRAAAERSYHRALKELRTLQSERATRTLKLSVEEQAEMPALARTDEVTKQSRSDVLARALDYAVKMTDLEVGRARRVVMEQEIQNQAKLPVWTRGWTCVRDAISTPWSRPAQRL